MTERLVSSLDFLVQRLQAQWYAQAIATATTVYHLAALAGTTALCGPTCASEAAVETILAGPAERPLHTAGAPPPSKHTLHCRLRAPLPVQSVSTRRRSSKSNRRQKKWDKTAVWKKEKKWKRPATSLGVWSWSYGARQLGQRTFAAARLPKTRNFH